MITTTTALILRQFWFANTRFIDTDTRCHHLSIHINHCILVF